jgi:phosphonate transport system ATP-binding protein
MPIEPPMAASMVSPEQSGANAPDAPLVLEGIRKRFGSNEVLKGVSLEVRRGELLAVLGGNGCGKSTLLRCAIRLLDPDAGSSRLCGSDLAQLKGKQLRLARREAAVVFQQIALVKQRTALDNVCAGALGQLPLWRSLTPLTFPHEIRERASFALHRVRMLDQAWQRAGTLSGGQAQRVAIARAYCQQASVILADEPVSALDPRAAEEVLELLRDLAVGDGLAVLAVLHQPDLALRHAHRVVGMRHGEVSFDKRPDEIEPGEIDALYGHLREA